MELVGTNWSAQPSPLVEIRDVENGNALVLRLDYDGSSEFGEGCTPDEAARRFWDALASVDVIEQWCAQRGYKLVKEGAE